MKINLEKEKNQEEIKTLNFNEEPSFAELWDACLVNLLYSSEKYLFDIENIFHRLNISKKSKLFDSSSGTGFPAIELRNRGYDIFCSDLMEDENDVFREKAKELGVSDNVLQLAWSDIPNHIEDESFDFMFCRGNSFIYAAGGWNESQDVSSEKSLIEYKKTLENFYNVLKPGGYLYIDKFKDSETSHFEKVASIKVKNKEPKDLFFYTKKFEDEKRREASMVTVDTNGRKTGIPNITYLLSNDELVEMLQDVGFSVEKIDINSEKHFDVWLARK